MIILHYGEKLAIADLQEAQGSFEHVAWMDDFKVTAHDCVHAQGFAMTGEGFHQIGTGQDAADAPAIHDRKILLRGGEQVLYNLAQTVEEGQR